MKNEHENNGATIIWRDPSELRPHPATKHLHDLSDDDPRFLAIVGSIEGQGYDPSEPIVVDEAGRIMEGRHRWRAAKRLQLARIACIERPSAEVAQLIIRSICARKHYSRSAIAFECYPLFEEAHKEAVENWEQNRKKRGFSSMLAEQASGAIPVKFVEDLAREMGVSLYLFQFAARVHKLFREHPDYADLMKSRLFGEFQGGEHESTRPVGLGAIVSGFDTWQESDKSSRYQPNKRGQLELFGKAVKKFVFQAALVDSDPDQTRETIRHHLEAKSPDELDRISDMADLLKTEVKRARKRAEDLQPEE